MTTTVYSAFWVLQRSAALHATMCISRNNSQECSNRWSDSSCGKSRVHNKPPTSAYDNCSSVKILLSLSELDVPDKVPWMAKSDSVAEVQAGKGTGTVASESAVAHDRAEKNGKQNVDNNYSSSNSSSRATRSTTAAISTHRSTLQKSDSDPHKFHPLRDALCVWACGAADGIESISFTRSQSLTAATAIR